MKTKTYIICPQCGADVEKYRNPVPTVDIIIEIKDRIVLIERKHKPFGWAIPGGFIDYGETAEAAAVREAREETSLDVQLIHLLGVYSSPNRDPRQHTISAIYVATGEGEIKAADDAKNARLFCEKELPDTLAFDHGKVLRDYYLWKRGGFSE